MDREKLLQNPLPRYGFSNSLAGALFTANQMRAYAQQAVAAERERCARVCDDEARMRTEAGNKHPEDSDSRGRCFAAARAAMNCARGVRGGEVV